MIRLLTSLALFLALLAAPLHAQTIEDRRDLLPGRQLGAPAETNAAFAIGLRRPGDLAYRREAFTGDALTVWGKVQPLPEHVGRVADIVAVVRAGTRFFMLDAERRLLPWDGVPANLVPLVDDRSLAASEDFTLYGGSIGVAGAFQFFVGYRLASGELHYSGTPQTLSIAPAPAPLAQCSAFGGRTVPVWHTSATGAFTAAPFRAADLALITNGDETNDPRFSYQWTRGGQAINLYAPADGVLVRIRHKARNLPEFDSDDYDLFFLVACDPQRPDKTVLVRFNHVTEPRADLKAAYGFGELGAPVFKPVFDEHEDRQVPLANIAVRAGDYIGRTSGTPVAHDFDFMIAVDDKSVCPFEVLEEPHRSELLARLGPITASPAGPPVPGYPCKGYGARP